MNIRDIYLAERDDALSAAERRIIFRTFAWAVLRESANRSMQRIDVRTADGDDTLATMVQGWWTAISQDDLIDLWSALERDRTGGRA